MKTVFASCGALALASAAFAHAPVDPTRPMVTGRGNVSAAPARVVVTNQVAAPKPDDSIRLDKFVVTGSLLPQAPAAKAKPAPKTPERK